MQKDNGARLHFYPQCWLEYLLDNSELSQELRAVAEEDPHVRIKTQEDGTETVRIFCEETRDERNWRRFILPDSIQGMRLKIRKRDWVLAIHAVGEGRLVAYANGERIYLRQTKTASGKPLRKIYGRSGDLRILYAEDGSLVEMRPVVRWDRQHNDYRIDRQRTKMEKEDILFLLEQSARTHRLPAPQPSSGYAADENTEDACDSEYDPSDTGTLDDARRAHGEVLRERSEAHKKKTLDEWVGQI